VRIVVQNSSNSCERLTSTVVGRRHMLDRPVKQAWTGHPTVAAKRGDVERRRSPPHRYDSIGRWDGV